MSTYAEVQNELANEIRRPGLSTEIQRAIKSAIQFYQTEQLWFLEERVDTSTVAGQKLYSLPSDFLFPLGSDPLHVTDAGSKYTVRVTSWDALENADVESSTGIPVWWAYGDSQMRVYPTPDTAYTLNLFYQKSLPELSSAGAENAWTVEGKDLIKARARELMYRNIVQAPQKADLARMEQIEWMTALRQLNSRRQADTKIRASYL